MVNEKISLFNQCEWCLGSLCCQYVTQKIKTPRSISDFDHLLWQVSHINTHLFKDSEGWYLLFKNICMHLQADGTCGIYDKRPKVCRDHSTERCEFNQSLVESSELYFHEYEAFDAYCSKRFKTWHQRFDKKG